MKTTRASRVPLLAAAVGGLLASGAMAEVTVKLYDRPIEEVRRDVERPQPSPEAQSATGVPNKAEGISDFWILPHIKIDSTSASGETTLMAIRNEDTNNNNTVTVEILAPGSLNQEVVLNNALLPREVWSLNLRQQIGDAIVPDADGFIRAWARIFGDEAPVSVDYFQIDPGQNFAAGGAPADIVNGEFCRDVKIRFLVGGTFSGGTLITFMQDLPLGGDPLEDPPSVTGNVYREDASFVNSFEIFTDNFSFQMDAADLVMGANFGSIDLTFENADTGFTGGFAVGEHKADGRYSVSLKSYCLDPGGLPPV